ncbi:PAS domain S-box protein [Acidovorax sp. SUPP2522]|uniref:two-component system sensor histidine kinase NtrB n=1 Tax=unclassified Acidovorax TaxID=2684926 RepID=UPI0023490D83|nr:MULTISPECIES: PAS domain S-box protein [unclassified Acidovorax]WCM98065.1 PAS domain S-box protein [Acidovorax sp. GBBC 1281]GKT16752.1 PAS domain S-box protein [Acidovorax sp. SUPP2522]
MTDGEPFLWPWHRWRSAWKRWSLWALLVLLVAGMLVTQVWLAGRYEASEVQNRLDRDAADAVADIRQGFAHNLQNLQALHVGTPDLASWESRAAALLSVRRELVRLEWRSPTLEVRAHVETPYRPVQWDAEMRSGMHSNIALACANARRVSGPSYSGSYFQPQGDGRGSEMMELCLPLMQDGRNEGFVVATYSLHNVLIDLVVPSLKRGQEVSFTEADGTRLAMVGASRRGTRLFSSQQLFDLPGATLVLRMDSWHSAPSVFPNVLTALVTAMSIALVTVLVVLVRDNRRRLRAERDLGDALAFRKAMEDSLVTGLRARDLQGRITYVNPAFCEMVGFTAQELLGQSAPVPYWPPEFADEYRQRQAIRLSSLHPPPREGYESTFMRKDGVRFPVLIFEAPLINAQGLHTGWMSAFLDVSEQRRVEEMSRASQERLQATARLATVGEMASLLSHELNQPLAAISSYASGSLNLLPPGGGPPKEPLHDVHVALQRIAQQAERAGRVIRSVHDFVRRRDQSREVVSVHDLLEAVMPLIRLQARKLEVFVKISVDADLPPVLCDRTMVEQVLLNLARNSMQAMDDPATPQRILELRVRRAASNARNAWLEFMVIDRGCGIAQDVGEKLFTPFFTTRPEGMGLGLSLCRTVVEQHGGFLGHAPNEPRGTVFTFTLPAASADSSHP